MLWGGGAPFTKQPDGTLRDRRGAPVVMVSGVPAVMKQLADAAEWKGVIVAVASCSDEPAWARECLAKFTFDGKRALQDMITVCEIHSGNKQGHFRRIAAATGCSFEDMIFFDNEPYNCDNVAKLGVTCVFCPGGVTEESWSCGLAAFPKPGGVIRC